MLYYPEERKREPVELTSEEESMIVELIGKIKELISKDKPPAFHKISYCKNCAFKEFCMS
jgi:CRISPR-associated exonuclease Cas4